MQTYVPHLCAWYAMSIFDHVLAECIFDMLYAPRFLCAYSHHHIFMRCSSDLAQNLNGDECFTFGAVFRAANLSTAFQVRQLGMIDITPYPVGVRIADIAIDGVATTTPVVDDATPTEDEKEGQ